MHRGEFLLRLFRSALLQRPILYLRQEVQNDLRQLLGLVVVQVVGQVEELILTGFKVLQIAQGVLPPLLAGESR